MIFEKLVVHRALRVHHFGRVALVRGKNFVWGVSALVWLLVSLFSVCFLHDCESVTSVFEESCFGF